MNQLARQSARPPTSVEVAIQGVLHALEDLRDEVERLGDTDQQEAARQAVVSATASIVGLLRIWGTSH